MTSMKTDGLTRADTNRCNTPSIMTRRLIHFLSWASPASDDAMMTIHFRLLQPSIKPSTLAKRGGSSFRNGPSATRKSSPQLFEKARGNPLFVIMRGDPARHCCRGRGVVETYRQTVFGVRGRGEQQSKCDDCSGCVLHFHLPLPHSAALSLTRAPGWLPDQPLQWPISCRITVSLIHPAALILKGLGLKFAANVLSIEPRSMPRMPRSHPSDIPAWAT